MLPVLPVLVQRAQRALAVLVQQELRVQELQAQQAQQELAPQEPRALLAYKALPALVLPAQRGRKAPLVLMERQAQRVLALTAPLEQREQPAQELQELLAPLALPVLKAQRAPSASALAQPAPQVLALRAPPEFRAPQDPKGPQELQA